jgi:hypothetical protein
MFQMSIVLFLAFVSRAFADECGQVCVLIPGSCGSKGSYCKNEHACHDIFWHSDGFLCNSGSPGCPSGRPLLCSQAVVIVASGNPERVGAIAGDLAPTGRIDSSTRAPTRSIATPAPKTTTSGPLAPIGPGIKGIKNLGATCFLGTVLQVLLHSPSMRVAIRQRALANRGRNVFDLFRRLEEQMYDETSLNPLDPHDILRALRTFNGNRGFEYNKADDAHQALTVLMDSLTLASPSIAEAVELHQGGTRSCVTCGLVAKYTGDPSAVQIVQIPDPSRPCRLETMLTAHFSPKSVPLFCPSGACGQAEETIVVPTITRAPQFLAITLSRYTFLADKLETSIEFPFELNLREVSTYEGADEPLYRLVGIVRHKKDHYTADYYSHEAGSWVHTDDSRVHKIKGRPGNSGSEPFLIFYERV